MWSKQDLLNLVNEKLSGYKVIIVSNREPYIHSYEEEEVVWDKPASGLTIALDPVMKACGGTWIAYGGGEADKEVVDSLNRVSVPPDNPRYSLKRIWLSKEAINSYYYGFCNEALWPLCHIVYNRPIFRESDWEVYQRVNRIFADAVLEEAADQKAFVFIQDYHLALVSKLIKEQNNNIITAQFWHIPWPNPETFGICPWQTEILEGLLNNDVLGFHTRYHCINFMDTVSRTLESKIDYETDEVEINGHKTAVRTFPISVDFEQITETAQSEAVAAEISRLKTRLGVRNQLIGVGIERYDYTKGVPDRIRALDRFLGKYPEYIGKTVFIQAGVTSRIHIEAYRALNREIEALVEQVNWKYSTDGWKPIILIKENLSQLTLLAMRVMAHYFIVSSLHDGMNLVAKEFVASRYDEDGVLILSQFTGSSRELTDAILINPFAVDYFADAIKEALDMPPEERQHRMRKMREQVKEFNIYKWAVDIITELSKYASLDEI
jgi:alpha,alpha-trehalose-phosphate synthase [UDP-forming]